METLYRKVGRRYVPIEERERWDTVPAGTHLLCVMPGTRYTRYNVEPALADVLAALHLCRDDIAEAINKATESRPSTRPLTPRERRAYAAWSKEMGEENRIMSMEQSGNVLDALEAALVRAIAKAKN